MILEQYIKLLESFKKNQISTKLEQIETKIFEVLYSKHISPRVMPYFPLPYALCLMTDETHLEPGTIYVREQNKKITYSLLTSEDKELKDVVIEELPAPSPFVLEHYKSQIISAVARRGHIPWAPFTDYAQDPDNISQIKKLINALYYSRLSFVELENVDVRDIKRSVSDLKIIYGKTINLSYEASYLLTHLDVDLKEMFQEELAFILPLFGQIQTFVKTHSKEHKALAQALEPMPLAYKAGEVAGIATNQMRPLSGDVDYNFLAQFSAVLPSYIDQLTQYIEQFSSQIKESEPKLNQKKLDELQHAALNLLNSIEKLKGDSLFRSLQYLNYIHIIRHVITLSMSSLEQMGELSESSQDLVRDKLTLLKYTALANLFSLVDKIEDNAMLKPGTLSVPLMEKTKVLYEQLLTLAQKTINFKTKGTHLLEIEEPRFIEARLEKTYKRIDKANIALDKIQKVQTACTQFFDLLKTPFLKAQCLHQYPPEIKEQLIKHYRLLKPYMTQVDIDLNHLIIAKLTGSSKEDWYSYAGKPWRWIKNQLPVDHAQSILAKESELVNLITKDVHSKLFHIHLNKDLIDSVHQKANLVLFPYSEASNVYDIDESLPLNIEKGDARLIFNKIDANKLLQNPEQLSVDQTLEIYQWYQNKHHKFLLVQNAYRQFMTLLGKETILRDLEPSEKDQCRNLYSIFQPYLIDAFPPEQRNDALMFDHYLVAVLSNKNEKVENPPPLLRFIDSEQQIQEFFAEIDLEWNRRSQFFYTLAQNKLNEDYNSTELQPDHQTGREHYVLPHTHYSKCIREFRNSLFAVTQLFNQAMQTALTPHASKEADKETFNISPSALLNEAKKIFSSSFTVPFPEMEENNLRLSQSKQVCALKDIFNSMFHLEGIVIELENLNNKSIKSKYVYYLLQAYGHLNEIINSCKRLADDPHLSFIARDLIDKAQNLYASFQTQSEAYQIAPELVPYGTSKVQYNPLWYVLNAFYVGPQHIKALKNTHYLSAEELNELHFQAKKSNVVIENLINNSNSYFKLFLQAPHMVYLYQELTSKLNEFMNTSHDGVIDNLDKIRSTILTPMLLEATRWENQAGFTPGLLSGPLRQITNEFFKGLLHPLGLNSKTHLQLVCDKEPLQTRINQSTKQISAINKYLKKIDREFQEIENLHYWYQEVIKPEEVFDLSSPIRTKEQIAQAKLELNTAYRKALPKLVKLKLHKQMEIPRSQYPEDHRLDEMCNFGLKAYDPHFSEIEATIITSHHYYLGLKATQQMRLATEQEQSDYLLSLVPIEQQEKSDFIEQYTFESFGKHLELMCNRHIGLQYTDKEYRAELKTYLIQLRDKIITQAKTAKEIDLCINNLLETNISQFEKKYYAEYYQLETIRIALNQFKIYFSYPHSNKIEAKKLPRINRLEDIASDTHFTIQERIREIKRNVVDDANFSTIILAHGHISTLSFTYFKLCFFSLLQALDLYTPAPQKLLNNLTDALNKPAKINELTSRFGLFAAKETENKRRETPALSINS